MGICASVENTKGKSEKSINNIENNDKKTNEENSQKTNKKQPATNTHKFKPISKQSKLEGNFLFI